MESIRLNNKYLQFFRYTHRRDYILDLSFYGINLMHSGIERIYYTNHTMVLIRLKVEGRGHIIPIVLWYKTDVDSRMQ